MLIIIVFGLLLAARDTITGVFNSFIILVDEPFRVGDAIRVEGWDEWGWVVEIGASQMVNYAYPDPTCRIHTDIHLDYDSDLSQVRRVIENTMRGIDEVLPDKPVQIMFRQFGEFVCLIRVHWWIAACDIQFHMADRVNDALEAARAEVRFNISFTTYKLDFNSDGNNTAK